MIDIETIVKQYKSLYCNNEYRPAFEFIINNMHGIYIEKAFIDIIDKYKSIDLVMNIGNEILISMTKSVYNLDNEDIMYSIGVNGASIYIGEMNIKQFVEKLKNIQEKLK